MNSPKWTIRSLAVAVAIGTATVVTLTGRADAQQPDKFKTQPGTKTAPKADPKTDPKITPKTDPKVDPKPAPKNEPKVQPGVGGSPYVPIRPIDSFKHPNPSPGLTGALPKAPSIIVHPQINAMPGLVAGPLNQNFYNPSPYSNPFNSPFSPVNNPFMNPYSNPFSNPYASPFMTNPLNQNPFAFNNPYSNPYSNPFNNPFANPYSPYGTYTPPMATQQPGYLIWKGPDLQVNPWSGTVYKPLSGIARTADGSTFYKVPGTPEYFDPRHGTYLNPTTGVISRPGGFLPWLR